MKANRIISFTAAAIILLTLPAAATLAKPQSPTSLLASARGVGKLKIGSEVFKVTGVIVKLEADGTAEITLITDLQLFITCTWSSPEDLRKGIDLKITGGATAGGVQGSGKLFLRADAKTIASLSLEGMRNTAKKKIQLSFVAE